MHSPKNISESGSIEPATEEQREAVLDLLFSRMPVPDRRRYRQDVLAGASVADFAGLFGLYRGNQLRGAVWARIEPGRTAQLWPPRLAQDEGELPGEGGASGGGLIDAALQFLRGCGVSMVQSLVELSADDDARLLRAAGFEHLCDLVYLFSTAAEFPRHEPDAFTGTGGPFSGTGSLELEAYRPDNHGRLAAIVERTYQGTLDSPSLNGLRDIEDVLTGYRANGAFDPNRWLIVRHGGADIGCLLLTKHAVTGDAEHDSPEPAGAPGNAGALWELVYMGLAPEARGRGWGACLTRGAQWLARGCGAGRLVLGVDAANLPALRNYAAAGFMEWDRKAVYYLPLPASKLPS